MEKVIQMNNQTIKYYVSRVNKETGEKQHIQKMSQYGSLFNTTNELSTANAYDEAEDAGMIVNHLNAIMEHFNSPFYYYVIQTIDDSTVWTQGMPEDVKQWFEAEEEDNDSENEE